MRCPTMPAGCFMIFVVLTTFFGLIIFDFLWDFFRDKKWRDVIMWFKKKKEEDKMNNETVPLDIKFVLNNLRDKPYSYGVKYKDILFKNGFNSDDGGVSCYSVITVNRIIEEYKSGGMNYEKIFEVDLSLSVLDFVNKLMKYINKDISFEVSNDIKNMKLFDILKEGSNWGWRERKNKQMRKIVDIIDVLKDVKNIDSTNVNTNVDNNEYCIKKSDVYFYRFWRYLDIYRPKYNRTKEISINRPVEDLLEMLRGISTEVIFTTNYSKYDVKRRIGDFLSDGKYWKEKENMNITDSCENKDMTCKLRAWCMREITKQSNFIVEEEFKKICIKERENILERIHEEIEKEAKKGNSSLTIEHIAEYKYMGKIFAQIYYSSVFYCYCYDKILRSDYFGFGNHDYLSDYVPDDSYVWKFVDKLTYETAKRISLEYVNDWIRETLIKEGFDVKLDNKCDQTYNRFTISW